MKKLHFFQPTADDKLAAPEQHTEINLNSSALQFLTDFKHVAPLTLHASTCAVEAKNIMLQSKEKMRFVVDHDNAFIGIITIHELSDVQFIRKTSEGYKRQDIQVAEMMIARSQLTAFDYGELQDATIEDVVHALQDSGQHHCLVLDRDEHKIRGILSASTISRKLQFPINIYDPASFYKVFTAGLR